MILVICRVFDVQAAVRCTCLDTTTTDRLHAITLKLPLAAADAGKYFAATLPSHCACRFGRMIML
jgi:hypothetical protein